MREGKLPNHTKEQRYLHGGRTAYTVCANIEHGKAKEVGVAVPGSHDGDLSRVPPHID